MGLAKQQKVLAETEQARIELQAEVKAHSGTIGVVKKEIEDLELAIVKVEQEKGNKDLIAANEKVEHMASVKSKLEGTLDELEGSLETEKKGGGRFENSTRHSC